MSYIQLDFTAIGHRITKDGLANGSQLFYKQEITQSEPLVALILRPPTLINVRQFRVDIHITPEIAAHP